MNSSSLAAVLSGARLKLTQAGIADAALDARLLVEHFSATTRIDAISRPDMAIGGDAVHAIEQALARRVAGEPIHRILGFREFYGLRLSLSAETLEPRPDTETLVDAVLPHVRSAVADKKECRILDLGTGTGAIALALLSAVPGSIATGVDVSVDALETARKNAEVLGLGGRFSGLRSDWFENVVGQYDVIVSNPPYIPADEIRALQAEVRDFDPLRALDGGEDGLDAYKVIAAGARAHLQAEGIVAVEIGSAQKDDVSGLFARSGFILLDAVRDLGGNDRVLVFRPWEPASGRDEITLGIAGECR